MFEPTSETSCQYWGEALLPVFPRAKPYPEVGLLKLAIEMRLGSRWLAVLPDDLRHAVGPTEGGANFP